MSIFNYVEYRSYIRGFLAGRPKKGRGELTRIAAHLNVNTTLLSQILGGARDFTPEQTFELSTYFGHTELEAQYFSMMVQIARTSHAKYRQVLRSRLAALADESLKLSRRVEHKRSLSAAERSIFYSSWLYSAVHSQCSLDPNGIVVEDVVTHFALKRERAQEILRFLNEVGLVREESFRFKVTTQSTFVERGSPDWIKHHINWRIKSIENCEKIEADEMMFTAQLSISKADFKRLREDMVEMIQHVAKTVEQTRPQDIAVLNLDWFYLR